NDEFASKRNYCYGKCIKCNRFIYQPDEPDEFDESDNCESFDEKLKITEEFDVANNIIPELSITLREHLLVDVVHTSKFINTYDILQRFNAKSAQYDTTDSSFSDLEVPGSNEPKLF
ncbi:2382_t:CDS:2, partial [Scutellospora calospora]